MSLRRSRARVVLALSAVLLTASSCGAPSQSLCRGCNVILLSIDTLRADALGSYGYQRNTTPGLDRRAGDGVVFVRAHSQSPWTVPAHFSILTGLYPSNHGVIVNQNRLARHHPTMASALQASGYETAAFVGGGYLDAFYGYDHGFDRYESRWVRYSRRVLPSWDDFLETAKSWLQSTADSPFFLFLHTYQVHDFGNVDDATFIDPALAKAFGRRDLLRAADWLRFQKITDREEALLRYMRQRYDSALHQLDRRLGGFFEFLESSGLWKNTILVITSDHGEEFGDHGHTAHGSTLYQEMIRVPLIIWLPPRLGLRGKIDTPVASVDILPTALDLLGLEPIASDGISLVPLLEGLRGEGTVEKRPSHEGRVIFSEVDENAKKFSALRQGGKLIYGPREGGARNENPVQWEYYDLRRDPRESKDLCREGTAACGAEDLRRALVRAAERSGIARQRTEGGELPAELLEQLEALGYVAE
ncbi:sulfatase [bacterium]|nr:sulfatase [bacterium]